MANFHQLLTQLNHVYFPVLELFQKISHLPYEQRLNIHTCTLCFIDANAVISLRPLKILNGCYDQDPTKLSVFSDSSNTRGYHMKIFMHHTILNVPPNFFTQRVINDWISSSVNIEYGINWRWHWYNSKIRNNTQNSLGVRKTLCDSKQKEKVVK